MATKVVSPGYIRTEKLDKKSSACGCSGIDGTNEIDVRAFQKWTNVNKTSGLAEDGKFGKLTKAEYDKYGAEWEASKTAIPVDKKTPETTPATAASPQPSNKIPVSITEKWKALSTTKKVLVIGGGVLVTTGIIVLIWKLIPKK